MPPITEVARSTANCTTEATNLGHALHSSYVGAPAALGSSQGAPGRARHTSRGLAFDFTVNPFPALVAFALPCRAV